MLGLLFLLFLQLLALPTSKTRKPYKFFYPKVTQKTYSLVPQTHRSMQDPLEFGINYLNKILFPSTLKITQSYKDATGIYHIYAVETLNDLEIQNHQAAVHIKSSQVLSFSTSFQPSTHTNLKKRSLDIPITLQEAILIAESTFNAKRDSYPPRKIYLTLPSGTLTLAYQFQILDHTKSIWLLVSVDGSGELVEVIDYYNDFGALVIPLPNSSPTDGFGIINEEYLSSPLGWQDDGHEKYKTTQGNNCVAVEYFGGMTVDEKEFMNVLDLSGKPKWYNAKVGVVNAFYLTNYIHDLTFQYGFVEFNGNFQQTNFDRGGKDSDPIIVLCQAGLNDNANFATPPDGQKPRMRLYTFRNGKDSSLDATIPTHEIMHGVTNRLTGGPQSGCLATDIARSLGEGWSDFLAMFVTQRSGIYSDVIMGGYVKEGGVRTRPYSIDMGINNLTLSVIKDEDDVHVIGEFWMSALYEVYCLFVDKHGFSSNLMDAGQRKGNIMMMVIIMTGLKLQACNPGFVQARDAIIAADNASFKGENFCIIWKGFAKRGLGIDVDEEEFNDGFNVPEECIG
jgi:Fungalysin metallopeptidase (M36)/Fungalysin/Thermolysin Propeptide Motif